MGFLEKEYAQNPTFTLDFINYLHSNHQHSQIKYINQTGYHRFELYFILESNDNIDHYAQWVTYTIYNSK